MTQSSVLLIDDRPSILEGLKAAVKPLLTPQDVEVRTWVPSPEDGDVRLRFEALVDEDTVLVITDYDLTTSGVRGLFGTTIVAWCQQKDIPVGDFSRGTQGALPSEPNLFEIRIPTEDEAAAAYIASLVQGFIGLRTALQEQRDHIDGIHSPAGVLAHVLSKPAIESRLAPYMGRLGAANAALLTRLREQPVVTDKTGHNDSSFPDKVDLLAYVLGHVLLNGVLRYPGPVLHLKSLAAYFATSQQEVKRLADSLENCRYRGPFSQLPGGPFYWRDDIDVTVEGWLADSAVQVNEAFDEFQHRAAETLLGGELPPHDQCGRCAGSRGGFWCPFTDRPVCLRSDCSVPSSSWIPSGADLTRVEREFFDEWAPLMGY